MSTLLCFSFFFFFSLLTTCSEQGKARCCCWVAAPFSLSHPPKAFQTGFSPLHPYTSCSFLYSLHAWSFKKSKQGTYVKIAPIAAYTAMLGVDKKFLYNIAFRWEGRKVEGQWQSKDCTPVGTTFCKPHNAAALAWPTGNRVSSSLRLFPFFHLCNTFDAGDGAESYLRPSKVAPNAMAYWCSLWGSNC